jgi:hypothetical protein
MHELRGRIGAVCAPLPLNSKCKGADRRHLPSRLQRFPRKHNEPKSRVPSRDEQFGNASDRTSFADVSWQPSDSLLRE